MRIRSMVACAVLGLGACRGDAATRRPGARRVSPPTRGQRADGSTFECDPPIHDRCAPIFASCGCKWMCPETTGEVGCDMVCENESRPPPAELACVEHEARCIAPRPAVGDSCDDARTVHAGEVVVVDTMPASDDLAGSCAGEGAPDVVLRIDVTAPSTMRVHAPGGWGGNVYVRRDCADAGSEIACGWANGTQPLATAPVQPGTYFVVVDATCNYAGATEIRIDLEVA